MFNIHDILPIFKEHTIYFKEKYKEVGDIYTFIFTMDKGVTWKPGQHGIFTVKHIKMKKATRPFSIASTPEEGYVKLSMKISQNPSDFKQALLDLKPGMTLSMRGPIGGFYPKSNKNLLMIAGGIGITPYRAILKQLLQNHATGLNNIQLFYLTSDNTFIYRQDFDEMNQHPNITIKYFDDRKALNQALDSYIKKYHKESTYFIVGVKAMNEATSQLLKKAGISKKQVVKDTFIGY